MPFGVPSQPLAKKRGLGCGGCGCALLLLIALLVAALVYSSYHAALKVTTAAPVAIAQPDGGPDVYRTVERKIGTFQTDLEHGRGATLRLDSDEINTYIARDPNAASVRGHLIVKLDGDQATLHSSLPLGAIENLVLPDRYANLDATFSLAFDPQTGDITVDVHDISVKGQPEAAGFEPMINQAVNAVIAKHINASASTRDFLSHTRKIAIENGQLVIETK